MKSLNFQTFVELKHEISLNFHTLIIQPCFKFQTPFFRLSNQARFILEKCDGSLTVENKRKKAMVDELQRKGFDSDPVF